jgi:hypothetical protein
MKQNAAPPSNKIFGLFFSFVFFAIAAYFLSEKAEIYPILFFGLSIIFCLTAFLKEEALTPLNKLWMQLGFLLGRIVSPIVLGLIFYGLFTPLGILLKLSGRDELRLKLCSNRSHWRKRDLNQGQTSISKMQF